MSSIGSIKRDVSEDRAVSGGIPNQRTAADAYRVTDEQLQKARLVVAKNSGGSEDLRELLDMLGLISANPDLPPPVVR
jgi:hypothetical protein